MTTATMPRLAASTAATATAPSRLLGLAAIVFEGIKEGRDIERRYDLLSRLTNSELARLGLTRQDIPRAAVNGIRGF